MNCSKNNKIFNLLRHYVILWRKRSHRAKYDRNYWQHCLLGDKRRQRLQMFGQAVIGPPGSGKTTYCAAMQQFMSNLGRKVAVVNLDPANDSFSYECVINISDLVTVTDVMKLLSLGPNGALLYCIEYLEKNFDWLVGKLDKYKDYYLLFDCPGQVELYTHNPHMRNILLQLIKRDYKLVVAHLVDGHYCTDPSKFISALFTSLSTMLQIELPFVNILSKVDLIEQSKDLAFPLEFFTEVLDLTYLLEHMKQDEAQWKKYKKLNEALADVIHNYSVVSFIPLDIQNKTYMIHAVKHLDKANGYLLTEAYERQVHSLLPDAVGIDAENEKISSVKMGNN